MAVIDLGNYGQETGEAVEPLTFEWYGEQLRVADTADDTALIDFLEVAGDMDEKDPRAAVAIKGFLRELVHPDDFDQFWAAGKRHRIGMSGFSEVAHMIIEAVTDLPTQSSSGSPAGRSVTVLRSVDDDYSEVQDRLHSQGRHDLAQMFELAQAAGVAKTG